MDPALGDDIVFGAAGISNSPLFNGAAVEAAIAKTHLARARARSGTVRFIRAHRKLQRRI